MLLQLDPIVREISGPIFEQICTWVQLMAPPKGPHSYLTPVILDNLVTVKLIPHVGNIVSKYTSENMIF